MLRPIIWLTPAVLLMTLPYLVFAQDRVIEAPGHRFTELADGVWFATYNETLYAMSNSLVLVGDNDVIVVDSHVTPTAARALRADIATITDKPIRYLINSHFHFDHAHGNQAFVEDVDIIGHTYTRAKLSGERGNVLEEDTFKFFAGSVPDIVANLRARADAEADPARKAQLERTWQTQLDYMNAIPEIKPTPPNITFDEHMVIFQRRSPENREIQLVSFGRGHTGGDVVVYLPAERMAYTADMMLGSLSYMGDGFVDEWPDALEGLKGLDVDMLIPGHGQPFGDLERIGYFQDYLRDLWAKTNEMYRQGLTAEQTAQQIDLTAHSARYPQITGKGADVKAIRRIYQLLAER
jgi:cyclase